MCTLGKKEKEIPKKEEHEQRKARKIQKGKNKWKKRKKVKLSKHALRAQRPRSTVVKVAVCWYDQSYDMYGELMDQHA